MAKSRALLTQHKERENGKQLCKRASGERRGDSQHPPPKCIKLPSSEGWLMKQYKSSGRIRESAG